MLCFTRLPKSPGFFKAQLSGFFGFLVFGVFSFFVKRPNLMVLGFKLVFSWLLSLFLLPRKV